MYMRYCNYFYCPLQLTIKPKFSSVEKIKTIGSTYMAATGLTKTVRNRERKRGREREREGERERNRKRATDRKRDHEEE